MDTPSTQPSLKHSRLGIASFILSIVIGFLMMITIAIAGVMEASTPGGMDEQSPAAILLGLGIIFLGIADLVSLGLGIAGLVEKDRKKIFAVLGTVFSAITLLGTGGLMLLGLSA